MSNVKFAALACFVLAACAGARAFPILDKPLFNDAPNLAAGAGVTIGNGLNFGQEHHHHHHHGGEPEHFPSESDSFSSSFFPSASYESTASFTSFSDPSFSSLTSSITSSSSSSDTIILGDGTSISFSTETPIEPTPLASDPALTSDIETTSAPERREIIVTLSVGNIGLSSGGLASDSSPAPTTSIISPSSETDASSASTDSDSATESATPTDSESGSSSLPTSIGIDDGSEFLHGVFGHGGSGEDGDHGIELYSSLMPSIQSLTSSSDDLDDGEDVSNGDDNDSAPSTNVPLGGLFSHDPLFHHGLPDASAPADDNADGAGDSNDSV